MIGSSTSETKELTTREKAAAMLWGVGRRVRSGAFVSAMLLLCFYSSNWSVLWGVLGSFSVCKEEYRNEEKGRGKEKGKVDGDHGVCVCEVIG